jgi:DHA2 family multidrug resistance protein-like MFS transporter
VVFLTLFLRRQRSLASPLLDLSMFKIRALSTSALLALLSPLIAGGTTLMAILYMQLVKGLTPLQVGVWMLAPSIALIMAGGIASGVVRKVRPGIVLAVGALLATIGMLVVSQVDVDSSMRTLIIGLVVASVGGGVIGILSATLIMSSAPPEKAGSAGSLSATLGEFGTALGVALLGLIGTVVYRTQVSVPAEISGDSATVARESIAGAVNTAAQTSGEAGSALLKTAQEAFTTGLNIVAIVAAVFFAGLAVLALTGLRDVPASGDVPARGESAVLEPAGAVN